MHWWEILGFVTLAAIYAIALRVILFPRPRREPRPKLRVERVCCRCCTWLPLSDELDLGRCKEVSSVFYGSPREAMAPGCATWCLQEERRQ